MKDNYFEQLEPDEDDTTLQTAKDVGYVPSGCMQGGEQVMKIVGQYADPCLRCSFDRNKCGGRR